MFKKISPKSIIKIPIMGQRVHAGFPSPADDYIEDSIDLNQVLITNSVATFMWRVIGDCMVDAKIFEGDTLIVDRSLSPHHNSIVLAIVDGEPMVKRLLNRQGQIKLMNENSTIAPYTVASGSEVTIWGVVTWTIRDLNK